MGIVEKVALEPRKKTAALKKERQKEVREARREKLKHMRRQIR